MLRNGFRGLKGSVFSCSLLQNTFPRASQGNELHNTCPQMIWGSRKVLSEPKRLFQRPACLQPKRIKKMCVFWDNFQLKQWFPNCILWYNISMKTSLKKRSQDQTTLGTRCNMYAYKPFMVHVHLEKILKVYRKENYVFVSPPDHTYFYVWQSFSHVSLWILNRRLESVNIIRFCRVLET